ncbi:MAG: hypothetical protein DMF67_19920 [Acidobacteria bacterium]|nr:MAG: hypothetical protein DMF66_16045 [Acidobacteriota bacterium]PYS80565.1 MAG: hypothetical protein DMF67_19920 [Acidobacteriota bacterium]
MPKHYAYGKRKELQVAEFLERRGYAWQRAQGSRGPFDIAAIKGQLRLLIQVKATRRRTICYTRFTQNEEVALIDTAITYNALPVLALVCGNYVWLVSVPDDELFIEGSLRTLKFCYPYES